ncbi:MAG: hypothetical protein CVV63_01560 [Tenericutes bacterium HGW-Tenericutes-8]|nr:MAG: hypothetical protein CVV63_01560 [Tenericutes bacterium HGW-Tenericutes-8]
MFMGRYLKASFQFDRLLTHSGEKFYKVFLYFMFLSLVYLLPMNLLIVRESGWRIDFIHQDFIDETPTWDMPAGCKIELDRFFCEIDSKTTLTHQDVTYIFNGTKADLDLDFKQMIFTSNYIIYSDGKGNQMQSKGYEGFETFNSNSFNLLEDDDRVLGFQAFATSVEASFSQYIVLYSVVTNTFVNMFIQLAFILMLALVLQLFRFGYQHFLSYIEGVKFVILAMGLPTVIGLIVGLYQPAFGSVFFQLSMGLTVMIVMLKYGKKTLK